MPPLPNMNSAPYPQQNQSMNMPPNGSRVPFGAGFVSSAYPNPNAYPPSSTTVNTSNPQYPRQSQYPTQYPQQLPNFPTTTTTTNNPYSNFQSNQGYSGYGFQQAAPTPNYPTTNHMNACFSEMQGHIRDVRRSKVRLLWFSTF